MTRGEIAAMVSAKIGLSNDPGTEEYDLIRAWINAGVVDLLLKTHCYVDIGDMALIAGVAEYRTDASILAVLNKRITSSAQNYSFEQVAVQDILDAQQGVDPVGAFPYMVAFEGNLMMVHPAPVSSDSIRFVYVPKPALMTSDSHDPSNATYGGIEDQYHRGIEYYANWQAAEYDDKAAALRPSDYREIYEGEARDIRKRVKGKGSLGLTRMRVGYPGQNRAGHRNDIYPPRF